MAGSLPSAPQPTASGETLAASPISLWEAYARGYATILQDNVTWDMGGQKVTEPVGYKVSNLGTVPILIDEKAVLLSPHPLLGSPSFETTQDGVLTSSVVPPGGSVMYGYAELVMDGSLPEPKWWCMEANQGVQAGIYVRLGGEILPFAMADMIDNYTTQTQLDVWTYMEMHPTLVVGKTPMWTRLPDLAGTKVDVTIAVTNMGIYNSAVDNGTQVLAENSLVKETIPSGYSYDPSSFNIAPISIITNGDGSKTLTWRVTIPGADVRGHNLMDPTPYQHVLLKYKLVLPELTPGRHFIPRAAVDTDHDGTIDAQSEKPLLEIYHVNRAPIVNSGGPVRRSRKLSRGPRWKRVI